jgi:hypothetical protein
MAKDLFHDAVKVALQKDGWEITHDPYKLSGFATIFQIDIGAERLIAAQRDKELIAVEVKSFISSSSVYDFHLALGQYLNYSRGMRRADPERTLFLAVPESAYLGFFTEQDAQDAVTEYEINMLVYNDMKELIVKWLPQPKTQL